MAKTSVASTLREQLVKTFEDPGYRPPPLPSIASDLLALAAGNDASVEEVVRLLERDPMLAGAVIRLVGSPIYAGRAHIRTLREAVIRLGVRTVRDVVFEAALRGGVFNLPEYRDTIEGISRHSLVTAYLTRAVCKHARIHEEHVFLCGLLHDIGFAALLFSLARTHKAERRPPLLEIWTDLDAVHEHASKVVTRLWSLPGDISALVGSHHHVHTGATSRSAAVVNLADFLTQRFSAAIVGPPGPDGVSLTADSVSQLEVDDSLAVLALDAAALDRIADDAAATIGMIAPGAL